jgi:S1-C subfamily serine protease
MRFVQRIIAVLFFVFLSRLLVVAGSRTDPFILTIEKAKISVVRILCGRFDEKSQFVLQVIEGTGFFIDDSAHFITAAHVIRDLKIIDPRLQPLPCVPAIDVPIKGWDREASSFDSRWFKFSESDCSIDDALDLAVCKTMLVIPFKIHPLRLKSTKPPDGTPVAFTGFPLGSPEPLTSRCDVATYRAAIDIEGSRELVLDKGTWPGASGSPIYDADGNVLGILLQRGIADGTGIAIGRPTHFILKFLHDKGIAVTESSNDKKRKQ